MCLIESRLCPCWYSSSRYQSTICLNSYLHAQTIRCVSSGLYVFFCACSFQRIWRTHAHTCVKSPVHSQGHYVEDSPSFSFVWPPLTIQYIIQLPSANDKIDKENNQHSSSSLLLSSFCLLCVCSPLAFIPQSFWQNQGIFLMCVSVCKEEESVCIFQMCMPAIQQVCLRHISLHECVAASAFVCVWSPQTRCNNWRPSCRFHTINVATLEVIKVNQRLKGELVLKRLSEPPTPPYLNYPSNGLLIPYPPSLHFTLFIFFLSLLSTPQSHTSFYSYYTMPSNLHIRPDLLHCCPPSPSHNLESTVLSILVLHIF